MASFSFFFYINVLVLISLSSVAFSHLSPFYYQHVCPQALPTIRRVVEDAIKQERRMGGSLLRMHFHDCFVNGCDASVLLDSTPTIDSEKNALPNQNNSLRGFEVIDRIKLEVDKICGCSVVSCADILAVAARDSVVALGGPTWEVKLGRRDSTTASKDAANSNLPSPAMNLTTLIDNFKNQGLDAKDLVALSGGHTLGFSQCFTFRQRIHGNENIDPKFARQRRANCPQNGGSSNLASLDPTPALFDTKYFKNLVKKKGLLVSDQALFSGGGQTDELVQFYSKNLDAFSEDFANSMIKMGDIKPLLGNTGEVRVNCRRVNNS